MGSSSPLDDQELITLFPALATAALKHLLLGAKLPVSRPPGVMPAQPPERGPRCCHPRGRV